MNSQEKTLRRALALLCALVMITSLCAVSACAWAAPGYTPPAALTALWQKNHDVIAGIVIPGTDLCYPIMQHEQDDYYLNICFDGTEGYPGSIYTNKVEGKEFNTFNTVIYGHNMRDGSYFGCLRNYLDPEFFAAHREIDIFTAGAKRVYDVFAVVIYGDRRITDLFDDSKPADRTAFLESLKQCGEDGILMADIPVNTEGHIITLSTCVSDMHDNRLLVVAAERGA